MVYSMQLRRQVCHSYWGRVRGMLMVHHQAYLLSGHLFVVVSFDPNTHHTRLVYNFLDDFATFPNDFAWMARESKRVLKVNNISKITWQNLTPNYWRIYYSITRRPTSFFYSRWQPDVTFSWRLSVSHKVNSPTRFLGTWKESSLNSRYTLACFTASGVWHSKRVKERSGDSFNTHWRTHGYS